MRKLIFVLVTAACLGGPALALAHRPASRSETQALIRATPGQRHYPVRCAKADNATVARGWAAWTFNPHARSCTRFGFDGVTYEQTRSHHWHFVWQSSDSDGPVPHRIATDLDKGLF
jgi:hypothetical protein